MSQTTWWRCGEVSSRGGWTIGPMHNLCLRIMYTCMGAHFAMSPPPSASNARYASIFT